MHFSANLAWLFKEAGEIVHRFEAAHAAGFTAVEFPLWHGIDKNLFQDVIEAKKNARVEQVLINAFCGVYFLSPSVIII